MLRISFIGSPQHEVALRLEGQVIGPWVEELRKSCEQVLSAGETLVLDLSKVSFIDLNGLALCRSLQDRHVIFTHCSAFVAEQLRG